MAQLRHDYAQFTERHIVILIVGPDSASAMKKHFTEHHLPFLGLPDPQHTVLKRYGQEFNLFKLGRMPAQVLVDRSGVARFAHYGHNMTDIPPHNEILELIDQLNTEVTTP